MHSLEMQDTHVCEADAEVEAIKSYRAALEVALEAPAAPHPVEAYGPEGYSLAEARRDVSMQNETSQSPVL